MSIQYFLQIKENSRKTPLEISHQEIDEYDFQDQAFNEVLKDRKNIRLYFDVDEIQDESQYKELTDWFESLTDVFGPYSIGGYTNDQDFADAHGFRFIEGDSHFLSAHIIYYTTMLSTEDLLEITAKRFKDYVVSEYVDPNVYKLASRQVFRHVLSTKYYGPDDPKNKDNAGYILDDLAPSTQVITPEGNEKLITREEWLKVIPKKVSLKDVVIDTEEEVKPKKLRPWSKRTIGDIDHNEHVLKIPKDDVVDMLMHSEPNNYNLFHVANALWSSPFSKEDVIDITTEWYDSTEHKTPDNIPAIIEKYYHYEKSNKWLFTLLKHCPKQYREKYNQAIDFTVTINNSDYCFEDISLMQFKEGETVKLLSIYRGVIGCVQSKWYIKTNTSSGVYIKMMNDDAFKKMLTNYKPFKKNNNISLAQIISKFSKFFLYREADMLAENKDDVINIFAGWKYQPVMTEDFSILEPLLYHIKHIICNDSEEKYDYFMKWFANIFQNITVKNGTMMIVHGAQGSGKSIAIELFAELFGRYALPNVDDLEKVFGKFNGLIADNLFINFNEPPESDDKFRFNGKIKAKLTQKSIIRETKGIDSIERNSWANYTMTTNNENPIREEKGDRRMIYFRTNNEKVGDDEYFNNLCKDFQPKRQGDYNKEYMGILLYYMQTQIDVSNWNPEKLIRDINSRTDVELNEQLERQYEDLNAVDRYVVDHIAEFRRGISLDQVGHIEGYKQQGIAKKLRSVCDVKRMHMAQYYTECLKTECEYSNKRKQVQVFKLKDQKEIPDLYNIILYKEAQMFVEHAEEEEEEDGAIRGIIE